MQHARLENAARLQSLPFWNLQQLAARSCSQAQGLVPVWLLSIE
jgi:hypothetical protein